ncbi:SDR family NAD(P)-dependent oxidoreductase [Streptomyces sp. V1I1]|uniref:SDR family NAD(P)-dependent oxidoreductase n=1 Tax=Streptomyces sp. V1I1 TaxID=3042272 RepID=UPI0027839B79|nr:SDR family NAD(P)-dependent oxidoreductase [Streptomyces sp. V1I1]MDQ0945114.1 NAD(P)-dependent dehydrogenase (short-subunit alcohol dehydrogenase family) [Streptomyces sp. V1I1]
MNVAQRVAIVTGGGGGGGGGGGIGRALVARLAREGARVVVADLDADTARAVSASVNADHPGSTVSAGADVSDKGSDYDRWLRGMRRYQNSLLAQS